MPLSKEELAIIKNELAELRTTKNDHALERDSVIFVIEKHLECDVHTVQDKPKLTVESVKGMIESKIKSARFEISSLSMFGLSVERIHVVLLNSLLKEISEA